MFLTGFSQKYTESSKYINVGQKAYVPDLSFAHDTTGNEIDFSQVCVIRNEIIKGRPLIVLSEPQLKTIPYDNEAGFVTEYFVKVILFDTDLVFYVVNNKFNMFPNYGSLLKHLNNAEKIKNR